MSVRFTKVCVLAGGGLLAALTLSASAVYAGNVGVDLNIHVGNPSQPPPPPPPQQVIVREVAPPPPPRTVVIEEDVNFIYPESLGFYVAVGVPYDLFYVRSNYYMYRDGAWLRSASSRGPWIVMRQRELPPGLRRHQIERIRAYRNAEYDLYRRDRDHYRGRHFVSSKEEWKERRKEDKERWKEEKREEKEERKQRKHGRHDD